MMKAEEPAETAGIEAKMADTSMRAQDAEYVKGPAQKEPEMVRKVGNTGKKESPGGAWTCQDQQRRNVKGRELGTTMKKTRPISTKKRQCIQPGRPFLCVSYSGPLPFFLSHQDLARLLELDSKAVIGGSTVVIMAILQLSTK